ncbi:hypothetical protein ONZ51_g10986 [Trametes cubensis]|uniref:Uncharacterized protein n=1 Tax=Trametes cubensis TaxID=1111947 RepID=A0AAD7TIE9_9APHY|nr:hypothetical protein ONZ51_g10986 [Trametes cubensis]
MINMDQLSTVEALLAEINREDDMPNKAHLAADKEVFPILRAFPTPLSPQLYGRIALNLITSGASVKPFLRNKAITNEWDDDQDSQLKHLVCKLLDALIAQGEQGTFKEVRRFKLLRNLDATKLSQKDLNERQAAEKAWDTPFVGEYHKHIYDCIMHAKSDKPYHNILPIVQSSGAGKSRLAHEVASLIFTLPLNVPRRLRQKSSVYPEPDQKVVEYLTATYEEKRYMQEMAPGKTCESFSELTCAWRAYLSEFVEATESRRATMNASVVDTLEPGDVPKEAWNSAYLAEGLQPLVDAMKSRVSSKTTPPPVLILFTIDEVDGLSSVTVDSGFTCYDIFLSALQDFRPHNPYLNTSTSRPPHAYASSYDAATPEFMAKYGRPVFDARLQAAKKAQLQDVLAGIADFAFLKLVGHTPQQYAQVNLLSNRMLIAFSIRQHQEYMRAGTASEPLLAHAAAKVMNEFGLNLVRSLTEGFKHGLLDKGQRGELVARLLLIFAHDKAQGLQRSLSDPSAATNWSQKVPRPDLPGISSLQAITTALEEAFDGAYVRFSHFVRLGSMNMVDTHAGAAALARGMAFQGYHSQPNWDVAIPVLMKDVKFDHSDVTFILVRVNARRGAKRHNGVKVQAMEGMLTNRCPYITIEMHLGVRDDADAEDPTQDYELGSGDSDDKQAQGAVSHVHEKAKQPSTGIQVSSAPTTHALADGPRLLRSQRAESEVPRYEIKAYGCSSKLYRVIDPGQEDQYASLLESRGEVFGENAETLDCVRRMKAVWMSDKPELSDASEESGVQCTG